MLALSLFISFLKAVDPFDLHAQIFFPPSAGKLPPTKSLIFAFLPLILLFPLGTQLIQRWDSRFLASMCIIFFLIIFNSLCFFSPPSILWHLPSQSSPLSIYFFPHCWCLLFGPPMCILIFLLFLASWHSSSLPASLSLSFFYLSLHFWFFISSFETCFMKFLNF